MESALDGLLPPKETADYLSVDETTLRDWRYRRQGPPYLKLGHRTIRYRRSDVDRWLKDRREVAS